MERRKFIKNSSLALVLGNIGLSKMSCATQKKHTVTKPVVVSTWNDGIKANDKAWEILSGGGASLDAVEQGVMVIEADPTNITVGYGGLPDRNGKVTLDACIMDHLGNAGSVGSLEHVVHAVSVARKVMEKTPHVLLSGDGALEFAIEQGFEQTNLLTKNAEKDYKDWLKSSQYKPVINIENHDTIGMLSIDEEGNLAGACTTSGLAFKMSGRIGDSPIIGAGLFVDNAFGASVCTGLGEVVLKNLCTFLAVEFMRQGMSPQEAAEGVIKRVVSRLPEYKNVQVGILCMDIYGETGAYAIHDGFTYAKTSHQMNEVLPSSFISG